jgi:hypothetical protein
MACRSAQADAPSKAPWTANTTDPALSQRTMAAPVMSLEN